MDSRRKQRLLERFTRDIYDKLNSIVPEGLGYILVMFPQDSPGPVSTVANVDAASVKGIFLHVIDDIDRNHNDSAKHPENQN